MDEKLGMELERLRAEGRLVEVSPGVWADDTEPELWALAQELAGTRPIKGPDLTRKVYDLLVQIRERGVDVEDVRATVVAGLEGRLDEPVRKMLVVDGADAPGILARYAREFIGVKDVALPDVGAARMEPPKVTVPKPSGLSREQLRSMARRGGGGAGVTRKPSSKRKKRGGR